MIRNRLGELVAGVRGDRPGGRRLVPRRGRDARREAHVAPQVEPVGDVLEVRQDLRLRRVPLRPVPVLLELVRPRVRVHEALDVAAGTGVPVPVPGAADTVARLDHEHAEAEAPETVQQVDAGDARTDDDDVERRAVHGVVPQGIGTSVGRARGRIAAPGGRSRGRCRGSRTAAAATARATGVAGQIPRPSARRAGAPPAGACQGNVQAMSARCPRQVRVSGHLT